jgi:hypothetical protein
MQPADLIPRGGREQTHTSPNVDVLDLSFP